MIATTDTGAHSHHESHDDSIVAARCHYHVLGHGTGDGLSSFRLADRNIPVDTTWDQEPNGEPGPAELFASSFAACLLKNLARSRALIGFRYDEVEVEVVASRSDKPPVFDELAYRMRVRTDESDRRIELAHRNIKKYGTVYNTLSAVCDVHGTVERMPWR